MFSLELLDRQAPFNRLLSLVCKENVNRKQALSGTRVRKKRQRRATAHQQGPEHGAASRDAGKHPQKSGWFCPLSEDGRANIR
jgi:hypothetical protein